MRKKRFDGAPSRRERAPGAGRPPHHPRTPSPDRPARDASAREHAPRDRAPRDERRRFLPGGLAIVHEDEDTLVVDKPAGMLTVPPPDQDVENAFGIVKRHVRDAKRRRGTRVWIIHRLDREASGLLVFAKSEAAFEALKEEFRTKRVRRLYTAVVEGEIKSETANATNAEPAGANAAGSAPKRPIAGEDWRTIQSFLAEDRAGIVRSVESPTRARRDQDEDGDEAKRAVTHYRVLAVGHGRSLVQVRLETGRKNQIRAHMAEAGRPIVGDSRYGSKSDPIGRVCLHAAELGFHHPTTGQLLRFHSEAPGTFRMLVGLGKSDGVTQRRSDEVGKSDGVVEHANDDTAGPKSGNGNAVVQSKSDASNSVLDPATNASPALTPESTDPSPTSSLRHSVTPPLPDPPTSSLRHSVTPPLPSSWDHVAGWYDDLVGERGSDHHERVILPGTLRLLGEVRGQRVLDLACGQGILARRLAAMGADVVGVDASSRLIAAAQRQGGERLIDYRAGDARSLGELGLPPVHAIACVMALMNIDPLEPVARGIASVLAPGGRFVGVILHPAFRAPGQTSWGWEDATPRGRRDDPKPRGRKRPHRGDPSPVKQFRRVDGYLSPGEREIVMNPGRVASGGERVVTMTYHRPIQTYVRALADAGLLIDAIEEWPSLRASEPGPRAVEENRIRREIPMFLALRGVKR